MRTKLIQMTQNNGIIDQYANEVKASQKVNARLWPDEPQMNQNIMPRSVHSRAILTKGGSGLTIILIRSTKPKSI